MMLVLSDEPLTSDHHLGFPLVAMQHANLVKPYVNSLEESAPLQLLVILAWPLLKVQGLEKPLVSEE